MASHDLPLGTLAVHDETLTAGGPADTITIEGPAHLAQEAVEVLTDGTSDVYVSVNGQAATVGGGNTYKLPGVGAPTAETYQVPIGDDGQGELSLISTGAVKYSITRA